MADKVQQELHLLERVFFRLAAAQTDDELEATLGTFLTPLLLKVSSSDAEVKKKVMELLTHINKRLKSRPTVKLPVDDLLKQYQDATISPFVHNFSILFIRTGYPRMDVPRQVQLAPQMVECMQRRPSPQQDCLIQLLLPILGEVKTPENVDKKEEMFQFKKRQDVAKVLLDYLLDVLLLPYSQASQQTTAASTPSTEPADTEARGNEQASAPYSIRPQAAQTSNTPSAGPADQPTGPPPGLSTAAVKRVTADGPLEGDRLEQIKLGILRFLAQDVFEASDVICHFMLSLGDSRHSVGDFSEHELKRISSSTDWEKPEVVNKMFSIFLGSAAIAGTNIPEERKRSPASIRVKQRIFPYLLRSRKATSQFPACLQVVFDSLFGAHPNSRLRLNALQFVHHMCLFSSDQVLKTVGPVLLSGMTKLIDQEKDDTKLRGLGYVAIGKLARRLPLLFTSDIALVQKLFDAICEENEDTRLAVQEALSMMAPAYRDSQGAIKGMIETLILNNAEKSTPQSRLVAVQFANKVFSSTNVPSRYVCMLVIADVKDDVREEAKRGLRLGHEMRPFAPAKDTTAREELPSFTETVKYVSDKATERLGNSLLCYVAGHKILAFKPEVFTEVLQYLRRCLSHSAGVTEENEIKNESLMTVAVYLNSILDQNTGHKFHTSSLGKYLGLIEQALQPIGGADLHTVALRGFLEVIAAVPDRLAFHFHNKLEWIKGFTYSTKQEAREYASRLLGIVVCSIGVEAFVTVVREYNEALASKMSRM